MLILTIGHSTRTLGDFIDILQAHGVARVVDIRTILRSRHNPQFNQETLSERLKESATDYVLMKELGGLRYPKLDFVNIGWRNSAFRGFADYMQTQEFAKSIDQLIGLAQEGQIAIMCAEVLPWRCHRWLIADALSIRGVAIEHHDDQNPNETLGDKVGQNPRNSDYLSAEPCVTRFQHMIERSNC